MLRTSRALCFDESLCVRAAIVPIIKTQIAHQYEKSRRRQSHARPVPCARHDYARQLRLARAGLFSHQFFQQTGDAPDGVRGVQFQRLGQFGIGQGRAITRSGNQDILQHRTAPAR